MNIEPTNPLKALKEQPGREPGRAAHTASASLRELGLRPSGDTPRSRRREGCAPAQPQKAAAANELHEWLNDRGAAERGG